MGEASGVAAASRSRAASTDPGIDRAAAATRCRKPASSAAVGSSPRSSSQATSSKSPARASGSMS
jgi:hypothetical protein